MAKMMGNTAKSQARLCHEPPFYITWALNDLLKLLSCWDVGHRLGHLEFHRKRADARGKSGEQIFVATERGPVFRQPETEDVRKYNLPYLWPSLTRSVSGTGRWPRFSDEDSFCGRQP